MAIRGDKHKTTKFRHFPILEIGEQNRDTSKVSPDTFRARQLAEVLRILKRPALLESEVYEGDSNL
jgi:hypothetical protein